MITHFATGGAARNGVTVTVAPRALGSAGLRGAVLSRFLFPSVSSAVDAGRDRFASITAGRRCAGFDYPAVVDGGQDFVLFWRTLSWDHAPGVLLLQEAGGIARRPDTSVYRPTDTAEGLLAAAASTWGRFMAVCSPGASEHRAPRERCTAPQNGPPTAPASRHREPQVHAGRAPRCRSAVLPGLPVAAVLARRSACHDSPAPSVTLMVVT